MAKKDESAGLLAGILNQTPFAGLGLTPQMLEKEVAIELNEQQLRTMLLQNADARARDSVTVELHEGKMVLKIRLW